MCKDGLHRAVSGNNLLDPHAVATLFIRHTCLGSNVFYHLSPTGIFFDEEHYRHNTEVLVTFE